MKLYEVTFRLNVIDFRCITRARNKKEAIKDVVWNMNLRNLKKINGIKAKLINKKPSYKKKEMKMAKHLILILEYDMGDYSDMEKDGQEIPIDPEDVGLNECFFQSDAVIHDMKIVGTKIEIR